MAESRILYLAALSLLLVMQGCSIAPTGKAQPEPLVIAPEPQVEEIPSKPVETIIETKSAPIEQQASNCVFHPNKGIAEVESVEQGKWMMRFYPGDIAFIHHSENGETQPGEEFRALRYSHTSGPCDEDYFEILGAFN
ncbi:hypothetical protein [Hahella sp. CCB-MM4]|uniref:hypothetical protein n=1 Tax=Hahella sp. (strain CCB-MM4) TaxID=1926491 RepID=UPI0011402754|nr:hypothetical protein [Hahella sp. CCB-MM4]